MAGFVICYGSTPIGRFEVSEPESDGLAAAFAARGVAVPKLDFTESDVRARRAAARARARERAQARHAKAASHSDDSLLLFE
jgi:hypothetical protein